MQSGLAVVFILIITRRSICDSMVRVLTVTAKRRCAVWSCFSRNANNFV